MGILINGPKLGLSGSYKFMVGHPDTGLPITGRDGVPVYRNASGFLKRAGDVHSNLITDRGLDQYEQQGMLLGGGMRFRMKVGTGNTAPTFADTGLAQYLAEAQYTGVGDGAAGGADNGDGTYTYTKSRHLEYLASGSVALAEFAFDYESGNFASIRELLRDEFGNPDTVVLDTGQKLILQHIGKLTIPFQTPVSFNVVEVDLVGTVTNTVAYTGVLTAWAVNDSSALYLEPGYAGRSNALDDLLFSNVKGNGPTAPVSGSSWPRANLMLGGLMLTGIVGQQAYTPGSHYADRTAKLPTSAEGPLASYTFTMAPSSSLPAMYYLELDGVQTIPKALNTHELTLGIRLSWARV